MAALRTLDRLRTLHDRELYVAGAERVRRREETNHAVLVALEDGLRLAEIAQALGISVALTTARLERARARANSEPLDPALVPLAAFADAAGLPEWKVKRLRRAGLIPSARWRLGQWWADPSDVGELPT